MFGKLKYLFLYAYEAAEQMEEKSKEFAEDRQKRMEQFKKEHQEMESRAKEKIQETQGAMKDHMQDVVKEMGLATQGEMSEIKKMIADLSKKIEKK